MPKGLAIGLCLLTTGCLSSMQRHPASGYSRSIVGRSQAADDFFKDQQRHKVYQAKQRLGVEDRPVQKYEVPRIRAEVQLQDLEDQLQTNTEKERYYNYKPYLSLSQQQIYLQLPPGRSRTTFAESIVAAKRNNINPAVADLIENQDITLGMTTDQVQESWGEPDLVEVAGNHVYGNKRWKYRKFVSSEDGYTQQTRIVYFEAGKVSGWEAL